MLFQSYKGKVFNSIRYDHYISRLGFSAEEYAVCIEADDALYIVLGDEDKHKALEKANRFVNKYKVSVVVRFFRRESADKLINTVVCRIDPPEQFKGKKNKKRSHDQQQEQNSQNIDKEESKKELDTYLNNYLNSLSKSKSDV